MSSNYPTGVTGNEPEIAGPWLHEERPAYCEWCQRETDHEITQQEAADPICCLCLECDRVTENEPDDEQA